MKLPYVKPCLATEKVFPTWKETEAALNIVQYIVINLLLHFYKFPTIELASAKEVVA